VVVLVSVLVSVSGPASPIFLWNRRLKLEARAGIEPAQEEDPLIGLQAVAASSEEQFLESMEVALCGSDVRSVAKAARKLGPSDT
jgi:hypothetical protein